MLTQLLSFASVGLSCERITVEVGSSPGEPGICIVGLGDLAVQESKQRVRIALSSSGFRLPTGRSITVNLAPADLKKTGPRFDVAIAVGLLIAHGCIDLTEDALAETAFIGELALDGSVRHVSGVLSAAITAREQHIKRLVVPFVDGPEAALIPHVEILAVRNLRELIDVLMGDQATPTIAAAMETQNPQKIPLIDFADVRGQQHAKRALEIAAAGGHNVLLSGAPGAGKTLLARALPGILPPLTRDEAIDVTRIYSVANQLTPLSSLITRRPFRIVHHTASGLSIVGGGQVPGPGEITLAHRGVLFLDELAEFPSQVLEVLRQPLEDREITITRAHGSVTFPADFILVAAMNPPEAGGNRRTAQRISPPLLDRIDLTISVDPVPIEDLSRRPQKPSETSAEILVRVQKARERQIHRFRAIGLRTNTEMNVRHIDALCPLDDASLQMLSQAAKRLGLSARAYHRTIKVARTIADLAQAEHIKTIHIAEALQYRKPPSLEANT